MHYKVSSVVQWWELQHFPYNTSSLMLWPVDVVTLLWKQIQYSLCWTQLLSTYMAHAVEVSSDSTSLRVPQVPSPPIFLMVFNRSTRLYCWSQLFITDFITRLHDKLLPLEPLQLCSCGSISSALAIPQVSCFDRWLAIAYVSTV